MKFRVIAAIAAVASMPSVAQAQQQFYARHALVKKGVAQEPSGPGPRWDADEFGSFDSTCSSVATRTRTVLCKLNGATVADGQCTGSKPPSSEVTAQSTGCGSALQNGTFETGSYAGWSTAGDVVMRNTNNGVDPNWGVDGNYTAEVRQGGSISQALGGTKAGGQYRLSFSWRPTGTQANTTLRVIVPGRSVNFTGVSSNVSWREETVTFAGAASNGIQFTTPLATAYVDRVRIEIVQ
jgi:hypothetical protein